MMKLNFLKKGVTILLVCCTVAAITGCQTSVQHESSNHLTKNLQNQSKDKKPPNDSNPPKNTEPPKETTSQNDAATQKNTEPSKNKTNQLKEVDLSHIKMDKTIPKNIVELLLTYLNALNLNDKSKVKPLFDSSNHGTGIFWPFEDRSILKSVIEFKADSTRVKAVEEEYTLPKVFIVKVTFEYINSSEGTLNFIFSETEKGWKLYRID